MLKQRETIVLKHIVREFVRTNKPVGSEKLAAQLGLSSASIRNTMSALLGEGLLTQPHTSAGRAPSDAGYRYFVDYLLEEYRVAEAEGAAMQDCLDTLQSRLDRMLKNIAGMLSAWTDCLAFVSVPDVGMCEINRLELTRVSANSALIILVLSNGMVETQFMPLPQGAAELPLERIARRLNERLHGMHVNMVNKRLLEAVFSEIRLNEQRVCESIKDFFSDLFYTFSRKIFVDGADELVGQPEFTDALKLRPVLEAVSEDNPGCEVFALPAGAKFPEVTIGGENSLLALRECSVIRSHFSFGDSTAGSIGIIGPRRMEYPRLLRLVDFIASSLSGALSGVTTR